MSTQLLTHLLTYLLTSAIEIFYNDSISRSVKPSVISMLADIATALEDQFAPYLGHFALMLKHAGRTYHLLTHSLTDSLADSLTHSLTDSLTDSPTYSLTH